MSLDLVPRRAQVVAGVALVTFLLCVLPILFVRNLPLHDYPFHMARMLILVKYQQSTFLQSFYSIRSFLLPNVGMDVIIVALSHLMPVEIAGRVFVATTVGIQLTGCMVLYRSLYGRYSLWPITASLFLFNWIFLFGFLNYLLGIGLTLWALAAWILLSRRSLLLAALVGSIFAVALFFCHLIAFGLFAVAIAGYQLQLAYDLVRRREIWSAALQLLAGASMFVLPICLFFLSSTANENHFTSHSLVNLLRTPAIFVRVLLSGDWFVDGLTTLVITISSLLIYFAGHISIARCMRLCLIFLLVTYILMPHQLYGGWGADTRIPVLIIFVMIGSMDVRFKTGFVTIGFLALITGYLIIRSTVMTYEWVAYDAVYHQFRSAFRHIPAGGVLFTASEFPPASMQDINLMLWQPPLQQVASLAVLEDTNVFVTMNWATAGQQPIVPKPRYVSLYDLQNQQAFELHTTKQLAVLVNNIDAICDNAGVDGPVYLLLTYPWHNKITLPQGVQKVAVENEFWLLLLRK